MSEYLVCDAAAEALALWRVEPTAPRWSWTEFTTLPEPGDDRVPAAAGVVCHRFPHAPAGATEVSSQLDPAALAAAGHWEPAATAARLRALDWARRHWPAARHLAVHDTPFFADLPAPAATYAVPPAEASAIGLRRLGRHGTIHRLAAEAAGGGRVISVFLGRESSAAALRDGAPVEVSAGVTAAEGLPGGRTSGDVDPAALLFLVDSIGLDPTEVERAVFEQGGVAGLAGRPATLAELRAAGDEAATVALAHLVHRVRRYIGAYAAVLDGLDAVVFAADPGYDDDQVITDIVAGLAYLGLGGPTVAVVRSDLNTGLALARAAAAAG